MLNNFLKVERSKHNIVPKFDHKALIFDMDGTMVDTMMVHHRGWQTTLSKYGLDLSLDEVKATIHGINVEILERLWPGKYSHEERVLISDEKESNYRQIMKAELRLIDGLPEFLENAHQAGIPMGIGTAAPKENVDFVLDELNIRHYFKAIIHAGDVTKGKPDPMVFLKVAELLGVPPSDCLVFEDSPTGAKTALNAGMDVIVITTTHQEAEFADNPAVVRFIQDFQEIDLNTL